MARDTYEKQIKSYEKIFTRLKYKFSKKKKVQKVISRRQRPHLMAAALEPQPTGPQLAYGLESSAIAEATYSPSTNILKLIFWNNTIRNGVIINRRKGGEYLYFGVSQLVWKSLMEAPSKGRFFNYNIRNKFPYRKVG